MITFSHPYTTQVIISTHPCNMRSFEEFVIAVLDLRNGIPDAYKNSAQFVVDLSYDYDDAELISITASYYRDITPEEIEKERLDNEAYTKSIDEHSKYLQEYIIKHGLEGKLIITGEI